MFKFTHLLIFIFMILLLCFLLFNNCNCNNGFNVGGQPVAPNRAEYLAAVAAEGQPHPTPPLPVGPLTDHMTEYHHAAFANKISKIVTFLDQINPDQYGDILRAHYNDPSINNDNVQDKLHNLRNKILQNDSNTKFLLAHTHAVIDEIHKPSSVGGTVEPFTVGRHNSFLQYEEHDYDTVDHIHTNLCNNHGFEGGNHASNTSVWVREATDCEPDINQKIVHITNNSPTGIYGDIKRAVPLTNDDYAHTALPSGAGSTVEVSSERYCPGRLKFNFDQHMSRPWTNMNGHLVQKCNPYKRDSCNSHSDPSVNPDPQRINDTSWIQADLDCGCERDQNMEYNAANTLKRCTSKYKPFCTDYGFEGGNHASNTSVWVPEATDCVADVNQKIVHTTNTSPTGLHGDIKRAVPLEEREICPRSVVDWTQTEILNARHLVSGRAYTSQELFRARNTQQAVSTIRPTDPPVYAEAIMEPNYDGVANGSEPWTTCYCDTNDSHEVTEDHTLTHRDTGERGVIWNALWYASTHENDVMIPGGHDVTRFTVDIRLKKCVPGPAASHLRPHRDTHPRPVPVAVDGNWYDDITLDEVFLYGQIAGVAITMVMALAVPGAGEVAELELGAVETALLAEVLEGADVVGVVAESGIETGESASIIEDTLLSC